MATQTTFYRRVGAAAEAGASIGSSIDIARAATTNQEAATAGRVFRHPTPEPEPERPLGFWDHVGGVVSGVGRPILRALEWGTEATGNFAEAELRYTRETSQLRDQGESNDVWRRLGTMASGVGRFFDPDWRRNWEEAVDANASVGQTLWLIAEEDLDRMLGTAGTSGSGIQDPVSGEIVGPRVRSGGLDLLDDPERYAERQEYFSEGAAHWTTGVGDALWQIFADPLLVAGKAGAVARGASKVLKADDVAKIADRSIDAADLTGKQRRTRSMVTELAESFEDAENAAGAVRGAARHKYLRNATDGGAIAYLMERAGSRFDDAAERIAAREDVIFAGMGDAAALERLGSRSLAVEVELRKLQAGLDDVATGVDDFLYNPALLDGDAVARAYTKWNDTDLAKREMEALVPDLRRELDAMERVADVGTPIRGLDGSTRAMGELAVAAPSAASQAVGRQVAKVAKTINNGPLLSRVHLISGMHLPGTFRLSGDDAADVFHAAVNRARTVFPKKGQPELYDVFNQRLLALEDRFLAAGVGAAAKVNRLRVMDDFNRLVDEAVAHKNKLWQVDDAGNVVRGADGLPVPDVDALSAVFNKARTRRMAELQTIASRVYKAREAGAPPAVMTDDGVLAFAGKPRWVDDLGTPVTRSQAEDYVSIIDPRQLDRFASAHFKGGLGGYVKRTAVGEGVAGRAFEATTDALALSNRLWKFMALLRPGAYFVRAQLDTQARILAMLGPLKYAAMASHGALNTVRNLKSVDKGKALALTERFWAHQKIDTVERELVHRGFDVDHLPPSRAKRAASLEKRLEEVRAARGELKGVRRSDDPQTLTARVEAVDAKIAALGPRAVKTRANLEAQRARLVERREAFERANRLDDEARELSSQVSDLRSGADDVVDRLTEQLEALREVVAKPVEWAETATKVRLRNTALARHVGQSARLDGSGNWKKSRVTDAYWNNDDFRKAASRMDAEDSILGLMTGATRSDLDQLRRTGSWDLVHGSELSWEHAYQRAVNRQIRGDALGQQILAGADDFTLTDWLRNDPRGRAYLRDMRSMGAGDPEVIITRYREHVDTLMPEGTPVRAAALHRDVTPKDMADTWRVPSDRPQVPGELLAPDPRKAITRAYQATERWYFNWVASVPENMMGRHPFYAARFEQHAKDALRRAGSPDENTLSMAQVNDIRRHAAQLARRDVGRYMFDTSQQSNIGHTLRFVSPFYGAWEDTMVKWARIFGQNPAAPFVFWDVMRSPNAAGWVVDREGNPIDVYGNVRDAEGNVIDQAGLWDGYVMVPLTGPLSKVSEWTGAGELRLAKNGANIIFQGDPFWLPGPGPIAAIPANQMIVHAFPEVWGEEGEENPILKYLLPFGPTSDSIGDQFLPSWARAARDVVEQDSWRVDNAFVQLYMEQVNFERQGLTDELTDAERLDLIAGRVRNWTLLRLFGTQMPVSFSPSSRLAHYKGEYDRYRRLYGGEADDRFRQDYPDFFDMAISLSANETGLSPADESWGAVQKYRREMAKHPEYGWFWAGAANWADGFSQAVYHAQLAQDIAPGTDTKFRSRKDPLTAARDSNVQNGWRDYQQFMTQIRLRMDELGLTSLAQSEAGSLRQVRSEFLLDLSRQNPDWAAKFNAGGNPTGKVTEFLSMASEQLARHPELLERGDGIALGQYLEMRDLMRAQLEARAEAGGARSINAAANADLRAVWAGFTTELVASDIGFEQMWDRVLGETSDGDFRDDLTGDIYARTGGE